MPRDPDPRGPGTAGASDSIRPLLARDRAVFTRPIRGVVALVLVMAAVQTARGDEAFLWLGLVMAGTLALLVPVLEWKLGTDRLVSSLPVRRATIVRARYVIAGLAVAAAWASWVAVGHLLVPALVPDRTGPDSWATLEGTLAFLWLCALLFAVFLPLFFRLGLGRAATAFFPALLGLYLAALAAASVVGLGEGVDGAMVPAAPGALTRTAMEALVIRLGAAAACAAVALAIALLWAASIRVSTRGFERRDL